MQRPIMLFAVAALALGGWLSAQEPSTEMSSRDQAREQMELWRTAREVQFTRRSLSAAHFVVGGAASAELIVISTVPEAVPIDIEAYLPAGERIPLGRHTVQPEEPLRLALRDLLAGASAEAVIQGSLRLSFLGDAKALAAWLVQSRREQSLEVPLQESSSTPTRWTSYFELPRQRPQAESVAWTLANHGAMPVAYRVRIGDGPREQDGIAGSLAPGAQLVLSSENGNFPKGFQRGWLTIEHDGAPGEVVVGGFLVGRNHLSPLPLLAGDGDLAKSYQAIRVPAGGRGSSTSVVLFARREARVSLSLLTSEGGATAAPRAIVLRPGEPETVEVERLFALTPAGEWRLRVAADVPVAVHGFHRSDSGGVTDLAFFPDAYGHGTGSYPLPDPTARDVFTTLVNVGTASASVVGQIFWQGGSYAVGPIEIPAGASRRIPHSQIIARAEPDSQGRTIPAGLRNGLFRWAATGDAGLIARTEVASTDEAYGFNCKSCCEQIPFGVMLPGDVELRAGEWVGLQAAYYYETCTGGLMGPYPISQPQVKHVPAPFAWDGSSLTVNPAADDEIGFEHEVWARSEICYGFWWNIWKWIFGQACEKTFLEPWSSSESCVQQTGNCGSCKDCCAAQQAFWTCKKKKPEQVLQEYRICVGLCDTGPCL